MTARVALVLLAGCSGSSTVPPSNPELEQLVAKEAEVEAEREGGPACVARVQWAGEPMRDLQQMGRACGVGERMHALTASREGSQAEGEAVQRYTFHVPRSGACYRVLATGESGIGALHLHIQAPGGRLVASHEPESAHAVVPPDARYCAAVSGVHTVEVSVVRGAGRYALQVWTD